jgi:hypothetical protein
VSRISAGWWRHPYGKLVQKLCLTWGPPYSMFVIYWSVQLRVSVPQQVMIELPQKILHQLKIGSLSEQIPSVHKHRPRIDCRSGVCCWRGGRDSNPRWNCFHSGLANRRTRPTMRPPQSMWLCWRRGWDSNPRGSSPDCFQDSSLKPLGHLSQCMYVVKAWQGRRDSNPENRFWRPAVYR